MARILQECPGVIGVKESNRNSRRWRTRSAWFHQGKAGKDPLIFSAIDALRYQSFLLGAQWTIRAIATAAPEDSVALWNAFQTGDQAKLHERLLRIWDATERAPMAPSSAEQVDMAGTHAGMQH